MCTYIIILVNPLIYNRFELLVERLPKILPEDFWRRSSAAAEPCGARAAHFRSLPRVFIEVARN